MLGPLVALSLSLAHAHQQTEGAREGGLVSQESIVGSLDTRALADRAVAGRSGRARRAVIRAMRAQAPDLNVHELTLAGDRIRPLQGEDLYRVLDRYGSVDYLRVERTADGAIADWTWLSDGVPASTRDRLQQVVGGDPWLVWLQGVADDDPVVAQAYKRAAAGSIGRGTRATCWRRASC